MLMSMFGFTLLCKFAYVAGENQAFKSLALSEWLNMCFCFSWEQETKEKRKETN